MFHAKAIRVLFVLFKGVTVPFLSKNSFICEIFLVFASYYILVAEF